MVRRFAAILAAIIFCAGCTQTGVACGCGTVETTNAKPYLVGQPVPWTWQLGTATTTVDKIVWESLADRARVDKRLMVQVTVAALTGQADYDIVDFPALSSTGQEIRVDAANDPTSDPNLNWKWFNAGEKYQGWLTFTVPSGPTEVYFTILGQRLAIWSVTGQEPVVTGTADTKTSSAAPTTATFPTTG